VLVVGLLLFVPIIAVRTFVALDDLERERMVLEPDCEGQVELVPAIGPIPIREPGHIHRYASLPAVPALWLGTLELVAPLDILERLGKDQPQE
jgi:hypothetical protein